MISKLLGKISYSTYAPTIRIALRYLSSALATATPFISEDVATTVVSLVFLAVLAIVNESWYLEASKNGLPT